MKKEKLITAIILVLLVTGCSSWSKTERALLVTFAASQAIGAYHVDYLNKTEGVHEMNGLFKDKTMNEALPIKGICVIFVGGLAHIFKDYRLEILGAANIIGWGITFHDQSVISEN